MGSSSLKAAANLEASPNDAVRNAMYGVASGLLDVVLVVGADKVRESSARGTFWEWMGLTRDLAWDYPLGVVAPANFALHVNRYLHESPATREHMAMVAVKNHHHGVSNPKAQLRFEITVDDVLDAPMVVEPFGLYDCTPQSDGAAALLMVGEEVVDRYTDRPVWVRGIGLGLDRVMHQHKADMTTFPPTVKAAKQAYAMAGVGPADVDVALLYDHFSAMVLMQLEDYGFCAKGEGGPFVESGAIRYKGGSIPVNTHGGQLSEAYIIGMTHVREAVEQLRGTAVNQVPGAEVALVTGGPASVPVSGMILRGSRD